MNNNYFEAIVDHKAIDYLIKSKHEPTSTRLVTLLDHLNRYTFDLKYLEGSKLKVSDALSRLYSEEKHKISDVIPLNFLLHFTDYQLHKESDHLANKLYAHKRTKLTAKTRRNYDRQAKHKPVYRYEPPKITKKTNKGTAVAKINECHVFNAISHQTKGRVAMTMPGSGQQEHCTDTGEEGHTEVCEQIQGNLSEQYGRRPERSPGTILLPRRGQNICLPSIGNVTRHTEESAFRENAKGLQSRRHQTPKKYNGKGPKNPCVNATGVFMKCGSQDNASYEQSQSTEGNGRKGDRE